MPANMYASVAEFRDRVGIEDNEQDYALGRVLEASSRWVDRALGRRFYVPDEDEVRYYTATYASWELCLPDDYVSITELATDANGDGTYETVWTVGTDYYLDPRNAPLDGEPYTKICKAWYTGRYFFPMHPNGIRITGLPGYCTLANCPPGIRELTMLVAEVDAAPMVGLAIPGVQNYKLGNELTVTMMGKNLPRRARDIIVSFSRNAFVH